MRIVLSLLLLIASIDVLANSNIDTVCDHSQLSVEKNDCLALVDFYHSFNVKNLDVDNSWGQADVSRWEGVNVTDKRVTEIRLRARWDRFEPDERLVGEFKDSFTALTGLRTLDIWGSSYKNRLPDFWGAFPDLVTLILTANSSTHVNKFPRSLLSLSNLSILEAGGLRIRERFPDFWGRFPKLTKLKLHNNLFFGEVHSSILSLTKLTRLNIAANPYLWGEFPFEITDHANNPSLFLRGSNLWGEFPIYLLKTPEKGTEYVGYTLDNNHFMNAPSETNQRFQNDDGSLLYVSSFDQTLTDKQEPHSFPIDVEPLGGGSATLAPKIVGKKARIFIVPDEGKQVFQVHGCKGVLKGNIYYVSENQKECRAKVSFARCFGSGCVADMGATNSVPNVKVESPYSGKALSGVVQLRGWVLDSKWSEMFNYKYRGGKNFYIKIDDQEKVRHRVYDHRQDVLDAMDYVLTEYDGLIGWSFPIYTGDLNNGKHSLKVFNRLGLQLAYVEFTVFNPTIDGSVKYIQGVEKSVSVPDFPIPGHYSEINFNVAEQSFTVVNQFDSTGKSVRSEKRHFRTDAQKYGDSTSRYKSHWYGNDSAAKIENPSNNSVLSGVQSMRGWFIASVDHSQEHGYFDTAMRHFYIDKGDEKTSYERPLDYFHRREDVNIKYDLYGNAGWSFLWYSGALENGWYKAHVGAHHEVLSYKEYVIQEVEFLSFTPVDENGEQFYVRSYDQDILVEDFPYQGSDVTLRFDPAGQNFVIVDQYIH